MIPKPGDMFKIKHDRDGVFVILTLDCLYPEYPDDWCINYKVLKSDLREPGEVVTQWLVEKDDFFHRFTLIPANSLMRKLYG